MSRSRLRWIPAHSVSRSVGMRVDTDYDGDNYDEASLSLFRSAIFTGPQLIIQPPKRPPNPHERPRVLYACSSCNGKAIVNSATSSQCAAEESFLDCSCRSRIFRGRNTSRHV